MKFKEINKKHDGKFITRYDITYETEEGNTKIYEMISRNKNLNTLSDLQGHNPDAVVLILTNEDEDKILLSREFRMAVGDFVFNFPAGLIDPGETPSEAAKRELWEETGLELYEITDTIGTSFSAVGFSNEMNVCIVGKARGTFSKSTSDVEEIEPGWYSKEEVRALLKTEKFAARTQAYCYLWCKK